jgi:hypothetical protein
MLVDRLTSQTDVIYLIGLTYKAGLPKELMERPSQARMQDLRKAPTEYSPQQRARRSPFIAPAKCQTPPPG